LWIIITFYTLLTSPFCIFKRWSDKSTALERVVRTTSEVFGPAGDHGVRDLWEARCAENGGKPLIGNYKDNNFNFNAQFQISAEIHLHRKDLIQVLESVKIATSLFFLICALVY
jgi:hypothetical protein